MEIEAKFILPDVLVFQRLQAADRVNDFVLSAHQIQQVNDTYLDSEDGMIFASGYSCRLRETEAKVLITVKGVERAAGAIHRREEFEVSLPSYKPPKEWPTSPTRNLILQLIGDSPLIPLLDLQQTRVYRRMRKGKREIALLSLDNVQIVSGDRKQRYLGLEIELGPQGTSDDITSIVAHMQEEWGLEPEPRSKFERALAFMNEDQPGGEILTLQEQAICTLITKRDDLYGRRAQGLLLLDKGITQEKVAEDTGRTPRTIRRWLTGFQEKRLGDFPERVLSEILPVPTAILPKMPAEQLPMAEQEQPQHQQPQIEPKPVQDLLKRYLVDEDHAQAVAKNALSLFAYLGDYHNLLPKHRSLLETAALLHDVGLVSGPKGHHKTGRDILLEHPPQELSEEERLIVSLIAYLHRKKMNYKKVDKKTSKKYFVDLSKKAKDEALALAALVRMGDGLDYSHSQGSAIGQVTEQEEVIDIEVTGRHAVTDAARAQKKSDLWATMFKKELRFRPDQAVSDYNSFLEEEDLPEESNIDFSSHELPTHPGLYADDPMGEAARKIFVFHLQRMLYYEEEIRKNGDREKLHKMRVATRRMRSAFRVFGDHLDMKKLKPIRKRLKRTGRTLGNMRDLDVFWEKTQTYLDTLPPERQHELDPLRAVWEEEREQAREELFSYLDSDVYAQLKESFAKLLRRDDIWKENVVSKKGRAKPYRVRHVVPIKIYKCTADVLAYEEWVDMPNIPLNRLHRLRIAGKRLRYTMEFFEEVLSPQTDQAIKEMKKLQDHLGEMQDALVASELLRDFLTWGTWGRSNDQDMPQEPILAPGVATYLADRQGELYRQLRTFPETWAYFQSNAFKERIAEIITTL